MPYCPICEKCLSHSNNSRKGSDRKYQLGSNLRKHKALKASGPNGTRVGGGGGGGPGSSVKDSSKFGGGIISTKCGHLFHQNCLNEYITNHRTKGDCYGTTYNVLCPLCGANLSNGKMLRIDLEAHFGILEEFFQDLCKLKYMNKELKRTLELEWADIAELDKKITQTKVEYDHVKAIKRSNEQKCASIEERIAKAIEDASTCYRYREIEKQLIDENINLEAVAKRMDNIINTRTQTTYASSSTSLSSHSATTINPSETAIPNLRKYIRLHYSCQPQQHLLNQNDHNFMRIMHIDKHHKEMYQSYQLPQPLDTRYPTDHNSNTAHCRRNKNEYVLPKNIAGDCQEVYNHPQTIYTHNGNHTYNQQHNKSRNKNENVENKAAVNNFQNLQISKVQPKYGQQQPETNPSSIKRHYPSESDISNIYPESEGDHNRKNRLMVEMNEHKLPLPHKSLSNNSDNTGTSPESSLDVETDDNDNDNDYNKRINECRLYKDPMPYGGKQQQCQLEQKNPEVMAMDQNYHYNSNLIPSCSNKNNHNPEIVRRRDYEASQTTGSNNVGQHDSANQNAVDPNDPAKVIGNNKDISCNDNAVTKDNLQNDAMTVEDPKEKADITTTIHSPKNHTKPTVGESETTSETTDSSTNSNERDNIPPESNINDTEHITNNETRPGTECRDTEYFLQLAHLNLPDMSKYCLGGGDEDDDENVERHKTNYNHLIHIKVDNNIVDTNNISEKHLNYINCTSPCMELFDESEGYSTVFNDSRPPSVSSVEEDKVHEGEGISVTKAHSKQDCIGSSKDTKKAENNTESYPEKRLRTFTIIKDNSDDVSNECDDLSRVEDEEGIVWSCNKHYQHPSQEMLNESKKQQREVREIQESKKVKDADLSAPLPVPNAFGDNNNNNNSISKAQQPPQNNISIIQGIHVGLNRMDDKMVQLQSSFLCKMKLIEEEINTNSQRWCSNHVNVTNDVESIVSELELIKNQVQVHQVELQTFISHTMNKPL